MGLKAVVVGAGAVGSRAARQLLSITDVDQLLLIDEDLSAAEEAALSLGAPASAQTIAGLFLESRIERLKTLVDGADVVVFTVPDDHVELARVAVNQGAHVVSVSDDLGTVEGLLELDAEVRKAQRSLVVGAGFAPGFTCLLARHAARRLDVIDEVHVAKFGTGGPACARQHHKALRSEASDWRNQKWEKSRGGSGRELCWFPDPVGGLDCYRAELPDPLLTLAAFPGVVRASARVAATRRDRSTKFLPMLRRPHPEGMIGAIRVEVRGWKASVRDAVVFGALDRPAVAAGTVAAVAAVWANEGRFVRHGAAGLGVLADDTVPLLAKLSELGVRAAIFEGQHSE